MSLLKYLTRRFPVLGEPKAQIAQNMRQGQKPDWMSWERWCNSHRKGYFNHECHWYDPPELNPMGSCTGSLYHNHQPRIMAWYWNPWIGWLTWPVMILDEIGDVLEDTWLWHRWALRHQITHHDAIAPDSVQNDIAVYVQDSFQDPRDHRECSCGTKW